jgi:oxygen-independent coproporphyrinogen III oxidase
MAGIYIHIPFCKQACNYCNFHFSVNNSLLPRMVEAIVFEANLQKHYLKDSVETIYFGGGTPSLLSNTQLTALLHGINAAFPISTNAEITLEANPDDITQEKLGFWKWAGINRLSIGVQSFFEEDLVWMNRAHNAQQAIHCIELAQKEGFNNISIDLIYGGPSLSDENWEKNLSTCFDLGIPHLSAYALTVEPKTALAKQIKAKTLMNIDLEKQATHFNILVNLTAKAGLDHYEISNFAVPGNKSKHNTSYWSGKHYLGLGPAAHSFNGTSRQWNISNNNLYLASIQQNTIPFEIEQLTAIQQLNEYIMTALRTSEGIDLEKIKDIGGETALKKLITDAEKYLRSLSIEQNENHLTLTREGKFFADGIAADLFQL